MYSSGFDQTPYPNRSLFMEQFADLGALNCEQNAHPMLTTLLDCVYPSSGAEVWEWPEACVMMTTLAHLIDN